MASWEWGAGAHNRMDGATVFGYRASDPTAYCVASFDVSGRAEFIKEKSTKPKWTSLFNPTEDICLA